LITLYAADSPNVIKIYLALEEMELRYRAIPVDVMAGAQFDAAFMRLNPNARVPAITMMMGRMGIRRRSSSLARSCSILLTRPVASCPAGRQRATMRSSG